MIKISLLCMKLHRKKGLRDSVMMLNATFSNISVMSWRSVLLVKTIDLPQVTAKLDHILLYRVNVSGDRHWFRVKEPYIYDILTLLEIACILNPHDFDFIASSYQEL